MFTHHVIMSSLTLAQMVEASDSRMGMANEALATANKMVSTLQVRSFRPASALQTAAGRRRPCVVSGQPV